jgi:hypothetical protein
MMHPSILKLECIDGVILKTKVLDG